jgi:nucleotide-binding universal stress UspA family protein
VLVVPDSGATATFSTIMVAWTDTRECRRAISDALPMLRLAERVVIAEVAIDALDARAAIDEVAGWLARHGIAADKIVSRPKRSSTDTLTALADEVGADLVVAGAYGHSRIREWAFGGVTRDLLLRDRRCTLLSH